MPRVIHFELSADEPERASKFYSHVFGWKIQEWGGPVDYWLITTGEEGQPGINGAILRRSDPAATTVNTIDVASVDEFMVKIKKAGGAMITPKMAVPGVGYMAYGKDPEGNTFGIMQNDSEAK